jgi:serine/threonine-protein kinase
MRRPGSRRPDSRRLDAAHRQGYTHRDLKPANMMVTKEPGNETCIELLDFGLAKPSRVPKHDDVTGHVLTVEGQITGTLQYMAPGQLAGKAADARATSSASAACCMKC